MLRNETLACLEMLVEERLELSSLITLEAREVVVVVVPDESVSDDSVSDVVEEESLPELLPLSQEIMVRLKSNTTKSSKILFIFSLNRYRKMGIRKKYFFPLTKATVWSN